MRPAIARCCAEKLLRKEWPVGREIVGAGNVDVGLCSCIGHAPQVQRHCGRTIREEVGIGIEVCLCQYTGVGGSANGKHGERVWPSRGIELIGLSEDPRGANLTPISDEPSPTLTIGAFQEVHLHGLVCIDNPSIS